MSKTFRIVPAIVFMLVSLVLADLFRVHGYSYDQTFSVPAMDPIGFDFRQVHSSAQSVLRELRGYELLRNNVYLPGVSVLYVPLSLLEKKFAYEVFTLVLLVALWVSAYLALSLGEGAALIRPARALLALLVSAVLYSTYPVQFALERGNFDLLALAALAAAIYFALFRPLLSGAFVGLAVLLKIYPVLILPALVRRLSPGFLVLALGIPLLGLVCLGPLGITEFISRLQYVQQNPFIEPINHSMVSFFGANGWPREYVPYVLAGMFLLLGLAALLTGLHERPRPGWELSPRRGPLLLSEVGLIGACVSFMGLAVGTSNDYKLVIQFFPFLLALGVGSRFPRRERLLGVAFGLVGFCLAWCLHLDRSAPRTPWIIGLFVLYMAAVAVEIFPERQARAADSSS